MDELNIGKKLQEFRTERGMTIRELSQSSGVTSSMLSQIERGLANPSIKTLRDIAQALNVPLYRFFKTESGDDMIVRKDQRKTLGRPEERDTVYSLLTPGVTGNIEFCLMEVPSGSESTGVAQSHIGEEVAFVLEGPVDIVVDGNAYSLDTGDSIRISPQSVHKWINRKESSVKVIFAITPPSF
ncbi:MAG: helix-turn-helix domain-containing protein [Clostridiales bacterium]|nr:helix-turn-helix domain-containing protein [Clostridiales bacterium]